MEAEKIVGLWLIFISIEIRSLDFERQIGLFES
jgi:hypothetical protein